MYLDFRLNTNPINIVITQYIHSSKFEEYLLYSSSVACYNSGQPICSISSGNGGAHAPVVIVELLFTVNGPLYSLWLI